MGFCTPTNLGPSSLCHARRMLPVAMVNNRLAVAQTVLRSLAPNDRHRFHEPPGFIVDLDERSDLPRRSKLRAISGLSKRATKRFGIVRIFTA